MRGTMEKEVLYVDFIGGRFECWWYSEGTITRVHFHTQYDVAKYARRGDFRLVPTGEASRML